MIIELLSFECQMLMFFFHLIIIVYFSGMSLLSSLEFADSLAVDEIPIAMNFDQQNYVETAKPRFLIFFEPFKLCRDIWHF